MNTHTNNRIKVIETKQRPPQTKEYMLIMRGIQTKEAAAKWGAQYGFATVYWIKGEEKVYGVRSVAESADLLNEVQSLL
jgi:rhodanese-related sulfurtransferase